MGTRAPSSRRPAACRPLGAKTVKSWQNLRLPPSAKHDRNCQEVDLFRQARLASRAVAPGKTSNWRRKSSSFAGWLAARLEADDLPGKEAQPMAPATRNTFEKIAKRLTFPGDAFIGGD